MKPKFNRLFVVLLFLIFLGTTSYGASKSTGFMNTEAHKLINQVINYPDIGISMKIEGFVLVDLTIQQDGIICINEINASNDLFKNYVIEKLNSLKFKDANQIEKRVIYRFIFKTN
jgi:hypothetical protein